MVEIKRPLKKSSRRRPAENDDASDEADQLGLPRSRTSRVKKKGHVTRRDGGDSAGSDDLADLPSRRRGPIRSPDDDKDQDGSDEALGTLRKPSKRKSRKGGLEGSGDSGENNLPRREASDASDSEDGEVKSRGGKMPTKRSKVEPWGTKKGSKRSEVPVVGKSSSRRAGSLRERSKTKSRSTGVGKGDDEYDDSADGSAADETWRRDRRGPSKSRKSKSSRRRVSSSDSRSSTPSSRKRSRRRRRRREYSSSSRASFSSYSSGCSCRECRKYFYWHPEKRSKAKGQSANTNTRPPPNYQNSNFVQQTASVANSNYVPPWKQEQYTDPAQNKYVNSWQEPPAPRRPPPPPEDYRSDYNRGYDNNPSKWSLPDRGGLGGLPSSRHNTPPRSQAGWSQRSNDGRAANTSSNWGDDLPRAANRDTRGGSSNYGHAYANGSEGWERGPPRDRSIPTREDKLATAPNEWADWGEEHPKAAYGDKGDEEPPPEEREATPTHDRRVNAHASAYGKMGEEVSRGATEMAVTDRLDGYGFRAFKRDSDPSQGTAARATDEWPAWGDEQPKLPYGDAPVEAPPHLKAESITRDKCCDRSAKEDEEPEAEYEVYDEADPNGEWHGESGSDGAWGKDRDIRYDHETEESTTNGHTSQSYEEKDVAIEEA